MPETISVPVAAARTGLTTEHLRRLCRSGSVKYTRLPNGSMAIHLDSLSAYLDRTREARERRKGMRDMAA